MSKELEIIGFNGGLVFGAPIGLHTPIAVEPRRTSSGIDWRACFKVGADSRDEISDALFDEYEKQGRVIRLPRHESIKLPKNTFIENFHIIIGTVKEDLLEEINKTRIEPGTESGFDFRWEQVRWHQIDLNEGRLINTSIIPPQMRTLRLLSEAPRIWYWVGEQETEVGLLRTWSNALMERFDEEWIRDQDKVQNLENLAWNAIGCALYDRPAQQQGLVRLYACFMERDQSEEITRKRFQAALLVLPEFTWESFKPLVEEYRETVGKGK